MRMYHRIPFQLAAMANAVKRLFDPYLPSVSTLLHGGPVSTPADEVGNSITNNGVVVSYTRANTFGVFGSSSYAIVGQNVGNQSLVGDFTVECTVNVPASSLSPANMSIVSQWSQGGGSGGFILQLMAGLVGFSFGAYSEAGPLFKSPAAITPNVDHHLVVQRQGNTFSMYVDGKLVNTATNSVAGRNLSVNLTLGDYYNSSGNIGAASNTKFVGSLTNVRITKAARYPTTNFTSVGKMLVGSNDPMWSNVSLAIDFDNGGVDYVGNTVSPTNVTNQNIDYGNYAMFDGTAYTTLQNVSNNLSLNGNFTIEGWFTPDKVAIANSFTAVSAQWSQARPSQIGTWLFGLGAGVPWFYFGPQSGSKWLVSSGGALTPYVRHHYAIVRNGNTFTMFIDGVQVAQGTSTAQADSTDPTNISLGDYYGTSGAIGASGSSRFSGFQDAFRLTKGVARYTANFTPPASFPSGSADANWSSVATNLDYSSGSTSDAKGIAITNTNMRFPAGVPTNQNIYSFSGGSAYNNNLAFASSSNFDLGSGTFTIEGWLRPTQYPNSGNTCRFLLFGSNGSTVSYYVALNTDGSLLAAVPAPATSWTSPAGLIPLNVWTHFAVVATGGNVSYYINGVLINTKTSTPPGVAGTNPLTIGYDTPGTVNFQYAGSMADIRVTKNVARYTGNFTPSTTRQPDYRDQEYNWDSVVSYLKDSAVDLRGVQPVLTGGVTVDSTNQLFGGNSIKFNSGYITAYPELGPSGLGTSDMTIEGWFYPTSSAGDQTLVDTRVGGVAGVAVYSSLSGAGKLSVWKSGTLLFNGTTVVQLNMWHHFAVVRKAGVVSLFLDGNFENSTVNAEAWGFAACLYGNSAQGNQWFAGNMRGLRVSAIARYSGKGFSPYTGDYPVNDVAGDPFWSYVQLCLDASSSSYDRVGRKIINTGVQIANGVYTFVGSSYFQFDATSTPINIGTGDFTFEFAFVTNGAGGAKQVMVDFNAPGASTGLSIGLLSNKLTVWNGTTALMSASTQQNDSVRHTVILQRRGQTLSLYLDGANIATNTTFSSSQTIASGAPVFGVSAADLASSMFTGSLDSIRLTNGVSRYTGTPVTQQALLFNAPGMSVDAYWKYISLQMDGVGNNGDTILADKVTGGQMTPVVTGPQVSNVVSRLGSTSIWTPSANQGFKASLPVANVGTGDFTMEGWFYPNVNGSTAAYLATNNAASASELSIYLAATASTGLLTVKVGGTTYTGTATKASLLNQWHHIAVTRKNGVVYWFVDGVLQGTPATNAANITDTGTFTLGGQTGNAVGAGCYINNFRFTKACRYTGNFIPPAYPFPSAIVSV